MKSKKDLIFDFDKEAKLEIQLYNRKVEVNPLEFRSWSGKRYLNDKKYKGPRYTWGTNKKIDSYEKN